MAVKVLSATYSGINGIMITVEVDITRGLPSFNMVGLADTSVKESKERVRSSIINSGYEFPVSRITVNLAPADIKKEGSLFDLPIAIGILLATGQIEYSGIQDYLFIGELSLSGEIKKVKGALPIALETRNSGYKKVIIPWDNANECSVVRDIEVYPFKTLSQVLNFFKTGEICEIEPEYHQVYSDDLYTYLDFMDIYGQESSKRALEVSASGFHNIILYGPPGCGKTMLAKRLPSILPKLTYEEALEVTKIYSVAGNLSKDEGIIYKRPFRSPHHTSSKISLVGGGNNLRPGEITLAHNGVLFLDEVLEFKKSVLEVLRQPIEEKNIKINRACGSIVYPSNFLLIAALNPCPCGYYSSIKECTCSEYERQRYLKKISGPLLDRIDLIVAVKENSFEDIHNPKKNKSSKEIQKRVEKAISIQNKRFKKEGINFNSQMNGAQIRKYCKLDENTKKIMSEIYNNYKLSTRAYSRIIKVARTIADLEGRESIQQEDIFEALNYRRFIDDKII